MALLQKVRGQCRDGGFDQAIALVGESVLEAYSDRIYNAFCKEYDNADYMKNIQWLLRHYHAAKKMTLSALFFTQAEALIGKHFKNLSFYACYYSLFNALWSNLALTPFIPLHEIRRLSHSRIFSDIDNYFVRSGIYCQKLIDLLNDLRLTREQYSYHLPLGGTQGRGNKNLSPDDLFEKLESHLSPILQVTELLSFVSHYAWEKKVGKALDDYDSHQIEVDELFFSFIASEDHLGKNYLIDDDDYRRQGYVLHLIQTPFPVGWFITEKLCEDLECGWEREETESGYDINNVGRYLS